MSKNKNQPRPKGKQRGYEADTTYNEEFGEEGEGEGRGERGEREGEEGEEEGEFLMMAEDMEDEPLPPPPPEEEKELLFLIEFLVDTLTINRKHLDIENIDPCALSGPTSVALCFLHFPPMSIGEKDVDPDRRTGDDVVQFNAGKSLMFALTESQFEDPPPVYLVVRVSKDMPHAFRFPSLNIGKTKIQLSELFKEVFNKYDENPEKTVSKSIKDTYELMGENGKTGGTISIYVRLTCLGENIVTEFQKAEELKETLLFKNTQSKKVYECKETALPELEPGIALPGYGDDKNKIPGVQDTKYKKPPPNPEDENFEEIFAEINGSAITIKVEKNKRKDTTRQFHVSEFCDCNIPLPQNLVSGLSDLSLNPDIDGEMNYRMGSPIQTDRKVGMSDNNELQFNIPPTEKLAQPGLRNTVTYCAKTCQEGDKHGHKGTNSYKIMTGANQDSLPKLPNDPEKDVFILRIIKKGRGREKGKDYLQLELKTPKEKIEPPKRPPYMIDRGVGQEKPKKKKKGKK